MLPSANDIEPTGRERAKFRQKIPQNSSVPTHLSCMKVESPAQIRNGVKPMKTIPQAQRELCRGSVTWQRSAKNNSYRQRQTDFSHLSAGEREVGQLRWSDHPEKGQHMAGSVTSRVLPRRAGNCYRASHGSHMRNTVVYTCMLPT